MAHDPARLYLELLKKTLAFSLWPEPPVPAETFNHKRPFIKRTLTALALRALKHTNLRLFVERRFTEAQREEGMLWPAYAHTMIGLKRLDNLQDCVETVIRENVKGDLIETGVWRGGACILMRAVLAAYGIEDRKVYVADSFEGLPEPDKKYPADSDAQFHLDKILAVSLEEVEDNFRKYGLLDGQVVFLKGWFKDTLPAAPIEGLAVLRLDGDMYSSTMEALTCLYPKLSPGGFCIIDDYDLPGCRKAVDDFRAERGISAPLVGIDHAGMYWRKRPLS